jgi:hypothetical protein
MESSAVQPRKSNSALVVGLIVIAAVALVLGAWAMLRTAKANRPTPIGTILADLRHWDGQEVLVEGDVSAPLNVMGIKAFKLTDDTGSITVVTERGVPADGEAASVRGFVKQIYKIGPVQQTVIYEPAEDSSDPKVMTRGEKRRERREERREDR